MCKDCSDTGKIQLLISIVSCDCTGAIGTSNDVYVREIENIDVKWMDDCCGCHISPPCGFCLRYAEAGLDEPEYCGICGDPSPSEGPKLCQCSKGEEHD